LLVRDWLLRLSPLLLQAARASRSSRLSARPSLPALVASQKTGSLLEENEQGKRNLWIDKRDGSGNMGPDG